jgi:hypothetical protein
MRIPIPLLAAACLLALSMSPSSAQINPEPTVAPASSVQENPPGGATPKPAAAVHEKKAPAPGDKPRGVRIDPTGVHVGDENGVDISMAPGAFGKTSWFAQFIGLVAVLCPFVTLVLIFAIILHFRHRRRLALHEPLRAMIEKGLPIPPELLSGGVDGIEAGRPRSVHRDLRGGLVLVGLGAVLLFLAGKWGAIPLVIGVALLIVWGFERWEKSKRATAP